MSVDATSPSAPPRPRWTPTPGDKRVAILLLLLVVGSLGTPPALRAASDAYACSEVAPYWASGSSSGPQRWGELPRSADPWGNRFRFAQGPTRAVYSRGPNGEDERLQGDDVRVAPLAGWKAAPLVPLAAAGLLLWTWMSFRLARAPRRYGVAGELLVTAGAVSLPAALAGVMAAELFGEDARRLGELGDTLVVPPRVAVLASVALVAFLLGLYSRLKKPLPPEGPSPLPRPSALQVAAGLALLLGGGAAYLLSGTRGGPSDHEVLRAGAATGDVALGKAVRELTVDELEEVLPQRTREGLVAGEAILQLGDAELRTLSAAGDAATPFLIRALETRTGASPLLAPSPIPWRHVVEHDPELGRLAAAVRAEPTRYRGLLLDRPRLLAALCGRDWVLGQLSPLLDDRRPTTHPAQTQRGGVRVCEEAAAAIQALVGEAVDFELPPLHDSTHTYSDGSVEQRTATRAEHDRACARVDTWWLREGAESLPPRGFAVARVVGAAADANGRVRLRLSASSRPRRSHLHSYDAPGGPLVLAVGPLPPGAGRLTVTDRVAGRSAAPSVDVPAGGSVQLAVDLQEETARVVLPD